MSVVGIDFGNQFCRVAVAHKGIVEVIANEVSNRKTPSMVAFDGRERRIGEAASTGLMGNYSNTVTEIKRLMGARWSNTEFQEDAKHFTYKVGAHDDGRVFVEVQYCDEVQQFSPEQLAGALFGCVRRFTSQALENAHVVDCVVSVPPYFTDVQRRAVLDASNIAGLNVLRLMNDTTAVALQYGILRKLPEKDPIRVAFVDVGHSSTDVAVVSFVAGKLNILGTASDRNLGGRNFDRLLADHMADDISARYKLDVRSNKKAWLRLLVAAERAKRVLSANHEAAWNVECIIGDHDVSGAVTRQTFEELAAGLLQRVLSPLKEALHFSSSQLSDLLAIEIVGGSVRIPAIRDEIEKFFGRPCSTTCDGDESVARGAALQCAMLSPSFRVRDFEVHDISPLAIEVGYGPADAEIEDRTVLFTSKNAMPSIKMISFHRSDAFQVVARYADTERLPKGVDPFIGRFVISGIPQREDGKAIKSKVKVKLDIHGVLLVASAQALEEIVEAPAAPAAAAAAEDTAMADEAPESAAEQPAADSQAAPEAATGDSMDTEPTAPQEPAAAGDKKEEKPSAAAPAPAPKPAKKKVKRVDLAIDMQLNGGLAPEAFQAAFEREVAMVQEDQVIVQTAARRNDLESYVYEIRDKMMTELGEYMADSARDAFNDELNAMEEWLYTDEGYDAQKSEFVTRLEKLRKVSDPVERRLYEWTHRAHSVDALRKAIAEYQEFAGSDAQQYAHIDSAKKQSVQEKCAEVDAWLSAALAQQERLAKCDEPHLTVAGIDAKRDELVRLAEPVRNTPKPKPKPAPKPDATTTPAAEAKPQQDREVDAEQQRADDTDAAMATEDTSAAPGGAEKAAEAPAAAQPATMEVD